MEDEYLNNRYAREWFMRAEDKRILRTAKSYTEKEIKPLNAKMKAATILAGTSMVAAAGAILFSARRCRY